MRRMNGSIIGPRITTSITGGASGMWGVDEQSNKILNSAWPTSLSGNVITYNFTSSNASATFLGVTITGIYAGSYTITNNNGNAGGVAGGSGASYGGTSGGGGGGIGGNNAFNPGTAGAGGGDVSGLFAAVSASGNSTSNFGSGGGDRANGYFAGGGGGGGGGFSSGAQGSGGAAAVVYKYTASGDTYVLVKQSAGAGSFTCPPGTVYVKIWVIGRGGDGNPGDSIFGGGGHGGHAGGVAYCEFFA